MKRLKESRNMNSTPAVFPPHDRKFLVHCTVPVATWVALILWIEWLCWFIRKHILYPFIWKLLNANTKAVLDILVHHEKPSDCRVPYSQTNTYIASKLYPGCSFFPPMTQILLPFSCGFSWKLAPQIGAWFQNWVGFYNKNTFKVKGFMMNRRAKIATTPINNAYSRILDGVNHIQL